MRVRTVFGHAYGLGRYNLGYNWSLRDDLHPASAKAYGTAQKLGNFDEAF